MAESIPEDREHQLQRQVNQLHGKAFLGQVLLAVAVVVVLALTHGAWGSY